MRRQFIIEDPIAAMRAQLRRERRIFLAATPIILAAYWLAWAMLP